MRTKQMTKKVISAVISASLLLGLAACGSNQNSSGDSQRKDASAIREENQLSGSGDTQQTESVSEDISDESIEEDSQEEEAAAKKTEYPVTITTYNSEGQAMETTYEKAPERVVAVYQGCIETMLSLGLSDHLIATAGLDNEVPDDQKEAFSKTNYLDEFTPSLETITMLEPDMIFSWGSLFGEKTLGEAKGWVDKGVNTYMNSNTHPSGGTAYAKTLENEYTDILNIGVIFDVQEKAEQIVNDMKDTVEEVVTKTEGLEERPSVLILESGKDSFTNYGANSLGGDMVTKLGGELLLPDVSNVGKEDIISANPDVIFVVYMPYSGDDPEQIREEKLNVFLEEEAFASLSSVQNQRVVPIMLSEMYASATRTKDGIVTFAKGLYPDLDL
ncbi:MAG: ABC transporter substrate-binding protein [Fusicatenibacter sp.]|nr:ABC transporter substrate-binding protein [Fusicatenibacter sp.]